MTGCLVTITPAMQQMQHRDQHSAPEFCFNFNLMEVEEF